MESAVSIAEGKGALAARSFFFMGILSVLLLFSLHKANGQEKSITIYPTAGITWRSTAMNFFNFRAIIPADPTRPYSYEKNVQGLSVNPGMQVRSGSIGLEYYSNLRYDVVHFKLSSIDEDVKDFIIDHNFNFIVKRKVDFGVGMSIVNAGEGYGFVNPIPRYHNIEFKTYNVFVTVPIKKTVNLEIKALYVPIDFPYNPNEQYIMYSLRVYYTFDFLMKKE